MNKIIKATPGSFVVYYDASTDTTKRRPFLWWVCEKSDAESREEVLRPMIIDDEGFGSRLYLESVRRGPEDERYGRSCILAYDIPGWGVINNCEDPEVEVPGLDEHVALELASHLECVIDEKRKKLEAHRKKTREIDAEIRRAGKRLGTNPEGDNAP